MCDQSVISHHDTPHYDGPQRSLRIFELLSTHFKLCTTHSKFLKTYSKFFETHFKFTTNSEIFTTHFKIFATHSPQDPKCWQRKRNGYAAPPSSFDAMFCSTCGQQLQESFVFCPKCGLRLAANVAQGSCDVDSQKISSKHTFCTQMEIKMTYLVFVYCYLLSLHL